MKSVPRAVATGFLPSPSGRGLGEGLAVRTSRINIFSSAADLGIPRQKIVWCRVGQALSPALSHREREKEDYCT